MSVKRPIGRNNLDKALHRLFKDDVDYHYHATKYFEDEKGSRSRPFFAQSDNFMR